MERILINGRKPINGIINISGAKNAAVAVLPAAVACNGVCIIDNLPHIEDVTNLVTAMTSLGVKCEFTDPHTLVIDSRDITTHSIDINKMNNMRASYYFMGAMLGRFKEATVPMPGGCDLGARPIDYHLKGFQALGAKVVQEHGIVTLKAEKLTGALIYLDNPSVGATINFMIAATFAEGISTIENCAKEPHVVDTASFLKKMGARIHGAGTSTIRIIGVEQLSGGDYTIVPDPIETGTYMIAGAITQGDVTVAGIIPKHMESVTAKLREVGCIIHEGLDSIRVQGVEKMKPIELKTAYYPGFPTDLQPQMATLLCKASGSSIITENIFEHRFRYANELKRLGGFLRISGRSAVTNGYCNFTGATVTATDLRAGAALVIAGLTAKGQTLIGGVKHIDRGYERLEEKLYSLGADIRRV